MFSSRTLPLFLAVVMLAAPGCKQAAKAAARAARSASHGSGGDGVSEEQRARDAARLQAELDAQVPYRMTCDDPTRNVGHRTVKGPAGYGPWRYRITTDATGQVIGREFLDRPVLPAVAYAMNGMDHFPGPAGTFVVTWSEAR